MDCSHENHKGRTAIVPLLVNLLVDKTYACWYQNFAAAAVVDDTMGKVNVLPAKGKENLGLVLPRVLKKNR